MNLNQDITRLRKKLHALAKEREKMEAYEKGIQDAIKALGGFSSAAPTGRNPQRRRTMSAAARKRIAQAMKKKWAERKAAKK
jgi:hypothetical protein